jgi:hypothetical protein
MAQEKKFVTCHILQVRHRGQRGILRIGFVLLLCIVFNRASKCCAALERIVKLRRIISRAACASRHRMADAK